MKKTFAALALSLLSGCGGAVTPELYAVIVDYFRAPPSCYASGQQPATAVTSASPASARFEVWDGVDGAAFLEIVEGGRSVDMGESPDLTLNGALEGTRGKADYTFTLNRVAESSSTILGNTITFTDTAHATVTFARGTNFKGTLSMSSSRTCAGTGCPTTPPACAINDVPLRGTLLKVEYLATP